MDVDKLKIDQNLLIQNVVEFKRLKSLFFLLLGILSGFFHMNGLMGMIVYFISFYVFIYSVKAILGDKKIENCFKSFETLTEGLFEDFSVY